MGKVKKKLGDILMEAGLIDKFQLISALGQQRQWGGRFASTLVNMGFIDEKSVVSALEKQLGYKCISLENREIQPGALKIMKFDISEKYCIMPLDFDNETLTIAISDPTNLNTIDELSFILGVKIKPVLAIESSIKNAIAKHYTGVTPGGKKYTIDTEKLPENIQIISYEKAENDTLHPREIAIEALVEILIKKGLITKEELMNKIEKKIRRR